MLLERIQAEALAARKAKNAPRATLLVTLAAEAARKGKDDGNRVSTDDEVLAVVRKFLKGVVDTLAVLPEGPAKDAALAEQVVLQEFLPQQVEGAALAAVIAELVSQLPEKNSKAMGAVMGALRARLGGNYDGATAKAMVQEALSK